MGKQEIEQRIWLKEDIIHYQVTANLGWTLPLSELEIVGEYTDPNGPYVDDYFFVFVTRPNHKWNEASFYAEGRDEFLQKLGLMLGAEIHCDLADSVDYKSRVMWPKELEDKPLFDFVPVESSGLLERIKHKLIPEYYFAFTEIVQDYLKACE